MSHPNDDIAGSWRILNVIAHGDPGREEDVRNITIPEDGDWQALFGMMDAVLDRIIPAFLAAGGDGLTTATAEGYASTIRHVNGRRPDDRAWAALAYFDANPVRPIAGVGIEGNFSHRLWKWATHTRIAMSGGRGAGEAGPSAMERLGEHVAVMLHYQPTLWPEALDALLSSQPRRIPTPSYSGPGCAAGCAHGY